MDKPVVWILSFWRLMFFRITLHFPNPVKCKDGHAKNEKHIYHITEFIVHHAKSEFEE